MHPFINVTEHSIWSAKEHKTALNLGYLIIDLFVFGLYTCRSVSRLAFCSKFWPFKEKNPSSLLKMRSFYCFFIFNHTSEEAGLHFLILKSQKLQPHLLSTNDVIGLMSYLVTYKLDNFPVAICLKCTRNRS